VQSFGHSTRLFCALLARQNVRYFSAFLILAATAANAGEPVGNLAIARSYQSPKKLFVTQDKSAVFDITDSIQAIGFNPRSSDQKNFKLESSTNYAALSGAQFEKQNRRQSRDPFLLIHKSLSAYGRPNAWMNVEAGYGQVWRDEFALEKEFSQREQPSFAYVTASFSF
jgi:hypothetical protein